MPSCVVTPNRLNRNATASSPTPLLPKCSFPLWATRFAPPPPNGVDGVFYAAFNNRIKVLLVPEIGGGVVAVGIAVKPDYVGMEWVRER